jgi:hypothetical protein
MTLLVTFLGYLVLGAAAGTLAGLFGIGLCRAADNRRAALSFLRSR